MNVLYNDVGHTIDKTKTFASDDTLVANTDDTLVAGYKNRVQSSLIVSDRNFGLAGVAPIRTAVERVLAGFAARIARRTTPSLSLLSFRILEVELLVDENDAVGVSPVHNQELGDLPRGGIRQPLLQSIAKICQPGDYH